MSLFILPTRQSWNFTNPTNRRFPSLLQQSSGLHSRSHTKHFGVGTIESDTPHKRKITQLLNYCATYPLAKLHFQASDMILKIHSDVGYGNESCFRSRAGGHYYLRHAIEPDIPNGAILNPTGILRHGAASSATEAEIGALFVNAKEGIITRITLLEHYWK